jgi:hypothetical protein
MRKVGYGMAMASLCLAVMLPLPHAAWSAAAKPRPPIDILGDGKLGDGCGACHASVSESHPPARQAEISKNETYTTKHYQVREKGVGEVRPVEPAQHQQFLE